MDKCFVCDRISKIKEGTNPYFVRELETGYVVIGDSQRIKGYTLFLCKQHATELHFLDKEYRDKFLQEMALVAQAVYNAFKPDKLNYELIGKDDGKHMHWHIFPRKNGDVDNNRPVWLLGKELFSKDYVLSCEEMETIKNQLNTALDKLLKQQTIKTVTICGSMRYEAKMREIAFLLETKLGFNVLQCTYGNSPGTEREKENIIKAHYKKIDISDAVYILDIDGYIGNSVQNEILYAQEHGKEIIFHSKFWNK